MCGFAGVVAWDERYRTSRETLARMSAAVADRGPDGEGTWFNHEAEITPDRPQVALAHRRLAIIDPDPRANQPFTDGQGRWIVFNGEIYNFRELKQELTSLKPDYEWRTNCDTEVLLIAYDVWGEKCVEHLNGMFAFAVWDENEKTLFLARDRMGQKPLFFAVPRRPSGGLMLPALAFASELGALRKLPWFDTEVNLHCVTEYLRWGYIPTPQTIYARAHQFSPSGWWRFAKGDWTEGGTYFHPNDALPVEGDPAARTRELLEAAVRRQLVSDVPLGCFLSGGIDSSIIAAAMTRAGGEVLTFSIGFDDPRYDESGFAEQVAAHLGTKHHRFCVRPDAATDLPKLAAVFGEPFGDSSALPTHYLARETRQHLKVALSGDGGDELFGGYDRYRAMRLAERLPLLLRLGAKGLHPILSSVDPKSRSARLRRFVATAALDAPDRYASYVSLFEPGLLQELCGEILTATESKDVAFQHFLRQQGSDVSVLRTDMAARFKQTRMTRDTVPTALAVDRLTYLPDDLLTKVDRASMLHALEVRSPFMDHELVQFAAGLTTDQLLKGGPKRMLREAFADDLPAWVFKRKKMGFAVPIGDWFRGELRSMLRDNLFASNSFARQHFHMPVVERLVDEHETQRVDHSQRLYALLMLELWWRLQ